MHTSFRRQVVIFTACILYFVTLCAASHAQTFILMHKFDEYDGSNPYGNLTRDAAGNLSGTTYVGGANETGVVFRLDTNGKETVLYDFPPYTDGVWPHAGLDLVAGSFYGTTLSGGDLSCLIDGCGTVFKFDKTGEVVLHSFTGMPDGARPYAGLIHDKTGNHYGTTGSGGAYNNGTIFEIDRAGNETVLYSFIGGSDGSDPEAALIRDSLGNLYGTTFHGGSYEAGTVFKLDTAGNETVLHSFTGGADGSNPIAALVRDSLGNLYGTTELGGAYNLGAVFKVDTAGNETVLYSFTGLSDGAYPGTGLIADGKGNFYGTASYDGDPRCSCGTVFKLSKTGISVLHTFIGSDGADPEGLIRDTAGNLYGTTVSGGDNTGDGVVFKIAP
jgi:uncharacterized repeat protein (TIGR03803 family)